MRTLDLDTYQILNGSDPRDIAKRTAGISTHPRAAQDPVVAYSLKATSFS